MLFALSLACPVKCFVETSEADLTGELSALSCVQLLNNLTNFGGLMKKAVLIVVVMMMMAEVVSITSVLSPPQPMSH